jgi:PKD repeat protein
MRNLLLAALLALVVVPSFGCESGLPAGPGVVTITETTTSTTTTSTTTTTIPVPGTSKFTFSPIAPVIDQEVFFDGTESTAPPGRKIINYDWNFGDGSTGDGPTPSHKFAAAGIFLVSLVIEDDGGGSVRSAQPIQVRVP